MKTGLMLNTKNKHASFSRKINEKKTQACFMLNENRLDVKYKNET